MEGGMEGWKDGQSNGWIDGQNKQVKKLYFRLCRGQQLTTEFLISHAHSRENVGACLL